MKREIEGVRLSAFEDPIAEALDYYSYISDGVVAFDVSEAIYLEPTPDRPYSAKSTAKVIHDGEEASELHIVAFGPFDGTGTNNSDFRLRNLEVGLSLPTKEAVVPRPKGNTHTEAMLAIASASTTSKAEPRLFSNNLDILGFWPITPDRVEKIAQIGQSRHQYKDGRDVTRRATATVGYVDEQGNIAKQGERFGDPHAIYNPWSNQVQVCGFLAINRSETALRHLDIFAQLDVQAPLSYS